MLARRVNVVLGIWLFVSAFLWPHTSAQMNNTWVLGLLLVAVALTGMRIPSVRYLNTALSVWLFVSAFDRSANLGTTFNNAIVAATVFLFSLGKAERETRSDDSSTSMRSSGGRTAARAR